MTDPWAYWKSEIVRVEAGGPPIPEDRHSDPAAIIQGYWRVEAAKTKHDWPVLLWREPNPDTNPEGLFSIQWGAGRPKVMTTEEAEEFAATTFLKCRAVRRADWTLAAERGQWGDGKISRPTSTEEKHDIIPDTPANEGGNNPVDEETGEEVDAFWLQIKSKLSLQADKASELGKVVTIKHGGKPVPFLKIESQADAVKAAAIRDAIREIGGMGEKKRKEEKKPHDDAAAAVQAKWVPVLEPASVIALALLNGIDDWQAREKARLEAEERERVRKETAERLKREADEAAAVAAAAGQPAPTVPTDDEIAAQAQQAAAEAPVEVAKPVVQGGVYSKAVGKAKTKVGTIVDAKAFVMALLDAGDEELTEFLQKRANAAARAKIKVAGVEFTDG